MKLGTDLRHPEVGTALLLRFCTRGHSQQLPRLNTKGQTRHPIRTREKEAD